jgi:hypothetical protein
MFILGCKAAPGCPWEALGSPYRPLGHGHGPTETLALLPRSVAAAEGLELGQDPGGLVERGGVAVDVCRALGLDVGTHSAAHYLTWATWGPSRKPVIG